MGSVVDPPLTASLPKAQAGCADWAARALQWAVAAWFGVALLGQGVFGVYVALFYGGAAARGEPERLNRVMPHAWQEGRHFDNAALWAHLLFAVVIVAAGVLQLWPRLRERWPAVHRWTGRTYLLSASTLSLGGLWLVWARGGAAGDLSQHLAITVNAVLILWCAAMAWRAAQQRRIAQHRVWALRLFVTASGVWLFRIVLMAWLGAWRAPVGFDPRTFSGPFLTALAWGVYVIVPLVMLEAVRRVQRSTSGTAHAVVAALLTMVTLGTAFGITMAAVGMWWPKLQWH